MVACVVKTVAIFAFSNLKSGKPEEAIKLYERSRALSGAAGLPIDHRQAVSYIDLGDKDKARTLLQRFVQDKRASPANLEDARKRLKELG